MISLPELERMAERLPRSIKDCSGYHRFSVMPRSPYPAFSPYDKCVPVDAYVKAIEFKAEISHLEGMEVLIWRYGDVVVRIFPQ